VCWETAIVEAPQIPRSHRYVRYEIRKRSFSVYVNQKNTADSMAFFSMQLRFSCKKESLLRVTQDSVSERAMRSEYTFAAVEDEPTLMRNTLPPAFV
jgi:hypothetical protein